MRITEYQKLINQHRNEFDTYYQELVSYNEKVNLTAITEANEVFTKLLVLNFFPRPTKYLFY